MLRYVVQCESKQLYPFHLSITLLIANYCTILIILSLLQTEIICSQTDH